MIINENFEIKSGKFTAKNGKEMKIVYIQANGGDDTYQIKDTLKNQFGAKWLGNLKAWGWFVDPSRFTELYQNTIVPCAKFLQQNEKAQVVNGNTMNDDDIDDIDNQEGNDGDARTVAPEARTYLDIIEGLIEAVTGGAFAEVDNDPKIKALSSDEIKRRLDDFYQELCSITSSEEFKAKLEPLIKWQNAKGHQFSLSNAILIWVQDPKATLVKSASKWKDLYNRTVKPNAPAICIWVPNGMNTVSKEDKKDIREKFLALHGYKSVRELPPGLKEQLNIELNKIDNPTFSLKPVVYDIRYTEQIPGTEDVVGSNNADDIPWFDESQEETPEGIMLYDAICNIIQSTGIKLSKVDDLGGARGVSTNGEIKVLNGIPRNQGSVSTLVHEFAHELLHQTYLSKSHNGEEWSTYFIGKQQGRAMVEQQAEICAWIVMRFFGYDMPTSVNYAGIWGMDENKVHLVFKSVANVATKIVSSLQKEVASLQQQNSTNEEVLHEEDDNDMITKGFRLTGLDLAQMLGLGDMYMQSVQSDRSVQECFDFARRLQTIL